MVENDSSTEDMEGVEATGLSVPKREAEGVRRALISAGVYYKGLCPAHKGERVVFPVIQTQREAVLDTIPASMKRHVEWLEGFKFHPARSSPRGGYRALLTHLPADIRARLPSSFDVVGDIAIIKLAEVLRPYGSMVGEAIMTAVPHVKAVYMDQGVRAKERVRTLHHLGGERRTVTVHKEWGLRYNVDVAKVYFSPRLATERMRVVKYIQRSLETRSYRRNGSDGPHGDIRALDMFAGVGPFAILIARALQINVTAVDINPHAVEGLRTNITLNEVEGLVTPIQAEAMAFAQSQRMDGRAYRYIIINLPHSAIDYLPAALSILEREGAIFLYTIFPKGEDIRSKLRATIQTSEADFPVEIAEVHTVHPYSPREDMLALYLQRKG